MTYIPHGPLWCWMVQGPDAVYFSQPTMAWLSGEVLWLTQRTACVARCQQYYQFRLDDAPYDLGDPSSGLTSPVQCGGVAGVDLQGRYFCDYHLSCHWTCAHCHAYLPHGEGGLCSEACREHCQQANEEDASW